MKTQEHETNNIQKRSHNYNVIINAGTITKLLVTKTV